MALVATPVFGRRGRTPEIAADPGTAAAPTPGPAADAAGHDASPNSVIADLRTLCLSRLDPAAVTLLPPDVLIPEVERLISTIATERRIQLNAREQLQLAEELVDDMLGLGPLEPLLEDDTINDIMVNGPNSVFIERRG